ncbi:MAG: hypothetical protein ABI367_05670 [Mucilaginibacter sp.]
MMKKELVHPENEQELVNNTLKKKWKTPELVIIENDIEGGLSNTHEAFSGIQS